MGDRVLFSGVGEAALCLLADRVVHWMKNWRLQPSVLFVAEKILVFGVRCSF